MKKIKIDQSIFRDYDIRGIYPRQLNEEIFFILGRAISQYLQVREIAVGHDTRLSSPSLFKALVSGFNRQNVDVVDLGLISTEMNYFASGYYGYPANIIVSASHNPPQYNGLKIVKKGVVPLHGGYGLPEIKKITLSQQFPLTKLTGSVKKKSIITDWINHLLTFVEIKNLKKLKVVIDAGNGMGGISWQRLINHLPLTIIPLYFEPDGHFPNHLPDPLITKNLAKLQKKIKTEKADLGFAIDGDADRLFVIDDQSQLLTGSITTAMLAEHLLEKEGPAAVLYSVTSSRLVPEIIKKHQGVPYKTRVGHSFIKMEMKKTNGLFAGEHSGHFYFRKNYYADSSSIAGLLFLEFLSLKNKKLSVIRHNYEKYHQSGEINYYVDGSRNFFHNLRKYFNKEKLEEIDGLTVELDGWWFNMRSSKTEPLVRLNLEADSKQILKRKFKFLHNLIVRFGGKIKKEKIT